MCLTSKNVSFQPLKFKNKCRFTFKYTLSVCNHVHSCPPQYISWQCVETNEKKCVGNANHFWNMNIWYKRYLSSKCYGKFLRCPGDRSANLTGAKTKLPLGDEIKHSTSQSSSFLSVASLWRVLRMNKVLTWTNLVVMASLDRFIPMCESAFKRVTTTSGIRHENALMIAL